MKINAVYLWQFGMETVSSQVSGQKIDIKKKTKIMI